MREVLLLKSMWKPQLYWGCELIPWCFCALISLVSFFEAEGFIFKILGIGIGALLMVCVNIVNKKDAYYFKILFIYIKQQSFYLNIAKYPSKNIRISNFSK